MQQCEKKNCLYEVCYERFFVCYEPPIWERSGFRLGGVFFWLEITHKREFTTSTEQVIAKCTAMKIKGLK